MKEKTKTETREEIIQDIGSYILKPLGILQGLFLLTLFVSPFIWIWHSWSFAWKLGLTGIVGALIVYFIYSTCKKSIGEVVDKEFFKNKSNKTSFYEK